MIQVFLSRLFLSWYDLLLINNSKIIVEVDTSKHFILLDNRNTWTLNRSNIRSNLRFYWYHLNQYGSIWAHLSIKLDQKKSGDSDCGKCCQVSQETEEKLKVYHLSFLLAQKFFLYNISSFLPCRWIQKWCNAILLNCFVMGIFLFGSRQHFQFSSG